MRALTAFVLLCAAVRAQGAGSCGVHLDVLADGTSTHAAIGDIPRGPGSGSGLTVYDPGNPFIAWATPGSVIKLRLSVPAGTFGVPGVGPFGAHSAVSIFWSLGSLGATNTPYAVPFYGEPCCDPAQPWIISVLPAGGSFIDGVGFLGPQTLFAPTEPGFPHHLELSVVMPAFLAPPDYAVAQALILTPGGNYAVSNGVTIVGYPSNPGEQSVVANLQQACVFSPTDEGFVAQATPPGFQFFGYPAPNVNITPNGYLDVVPNGTNGSCDYSGSPGGFGCGSGFPTVEPRIAVNHFDADVAATFPGIPPADITVESAPAGPTWPSRLIIRWKHDGWFGDQRDYASFVCELWGNDQPGPATDLNNSIICVRQDIKTFNNTGAVGLVGIGPGDVGQGYGGPGSLCNFPSVAAYYGCCAYNGFPGEATTLAVVYDPGASPFLMNIAVHMQPNSVGVSLPQGYDFTFH